MTQTPNQKNQEPYRTHPQGPPCPGNPPGIHDFKPRYGWTTSSIKRTLDNPHLSSNSSLLSLFIFFASHHHYVSPIHPDLRPFSFLHSLTYPRTCTCLFVD